MSSALRLACVSVTVALIAAGGATAEVLIPSDFFNAPIDPSAPSVIEANTLTFDRASNVILANGHVVLKRGGYALTGQDLVYNRNTDHVHFIGAATIRDPSGNLTETTDLKVTGEMKQAFLEAMTITTYDGARITADSADYDAALETLLVNATYAPCGECIDSKGRRIGWSMKAKRVISNSKDNSLYLDQPSLAILGIPVAWLPFLWLPDTSDSVLSRIPKPTYSFTEKTGHALAFTSTVHSSRWTDVILTPTLMSRQGLLVGAEWVQRFNSGSFRVKGSGLYQRDLSAFTFSEAKRSRRGAIQVSGSFQPTEDWTVGMSYTAFTDAAYLPDYTRTDDKSSVNEVYATNLTENTYIDALVQSFTLLGDVTEASQGQQGQTMPTVRFEHVEDLAPGMGRIEVSGKLLRVHRNLDSTTSVADTPYTFGYADNKQHANFQADWQNQYIGGGGFIFTPYLGGRVDAAYYDGSSAIGPRATTLFSATPIAAMDIRYPMAANDGLTVHVVEPIAQLVYRGSDTTALGVTNDDAQSFVFDDTNLFSYNRFSGSDRQETGLRANIGGRYQVNFADNTYLELIAGQSFQLAGANAFAATDPAQTAAGGGLDTTASYAVLGAYGVFETGIKVSGKLQINTAIPSISRAGFGANFSKEGYSTGIDYNYLAANIAAGVISDQHEIGGNVGVPIADYWTLKAASYWDLQTNKWYNVSGGLQYDDGYLLMSLDGTRTNGVADDTKITATFSIKAPAGLNLGYSRVLTPGQ
ncbi:MAG: LPS assembly protein LptD [Candidatus Devosia symbiotica]|nr:LPS assembly protein LptD [Candidatus Devosia symbiotica]